MARPQPLIGDRAAARALLGAPVVAAIALMVLNDHLLKRAGVLPSPITGKLSDFAFLFFSPVVLAYALRARSLPGLLACHAAPATLFATLNLSPAASEAFTAAMSLVVPMKLWPDPTDLIALAALPLSWRQLRAADGPPASPTPPKASVSRARILVATLAAISCMATSPPHRPPIAPSREPIYMSWEELRTSAVQVLPPRPIGKRGKLLVVDDYLFLSEPGQGVHVFDNRDREDPLPLLFLRIPGNIDIAVRGNLLYADSFVDLLTFELDLQAGTMRLVGRLTDQFEYDPHQALDEEEPTWFPADPSRGVVIGLRPLDPPTGARP